MTEKELNLDQLQDNLISSIKSWQKSVTENRDEDASYYAKKVGNQINEALDFELSVRIPLTSMKVETTNPVFILKIANLFASSESVSNPYITVGGTSFEREGVEFGILLDRDSLIITTNKQERLFTFKSGDINTEEVKIR